MKPSASSLWLTEFCTWPLRPEVHVERDVSGQAAKNGKAFHSLADQYLTGRTPEFEEGSDLEWVQARMPSWIEWLNGYVGGRYCEAEVPFIYDWKTTKTRVEAHDWVSGERNRGLTEIPCIADLVLIGAGGSVEIVDYKSGKLLPTVADNYQMLCLGAAAASWFGLAEVKLTLLYARVRKVRQDSVTVSVLDLANWESSLQERLSKAPTSEPHPGDWCWRCKVQSICPAKGGWGNEIPFG